MPGNRTRLLLTLLFCLCSRLVFGQVTASFVADDTSGCVPMIVHFTNTSTGATSYSWNLGNSTTSTSTNASASYTSAGTYTVTLTAYNGASSSTYSLLIHVYAPPTVSFTYTDTAVCPYAPVTFTSTSISNSWGTPIYSWNFGDGGTTAGSPTTYTYATPGYYNVTLFVTNGAGCTNSLTKTALIHVFNHSSVAFSATPTSFCKTPSLVNFTNGTTGKSPLSYKWSFGDGGTSTLTNPAHSYTSTGSYNVTLKVTDGKGCIDSVVNSSMINAGSTISAFTMPPAVCATSPVNYTNMSTSHITSQWFFGDGGTSTDENPTYSYSVPGVYPVKLVVFDGACYDTSTKSIVVNPLPTGSFTSSPSKPCPPPVSVTYTASVGGGTSVAWKFGDGTTGAGTTKIKNYPTAVIDYVDMILTNTAGCTSTVRRIDTIYNLYLNPTSSSSDGCAPLTTTFNLYAYSIVFDNFNMTFDFFSYPYAISTYSWNFGDGSPTGSGPSPAHTYTLPGIYTATVNVTTVNGCTASGTVSISVGSPQTASFTSKPTHICAGQTISYKSTSTGSIDWYDWSFADGGGESGPTKTAPTHTFTVPGIFDVSLVVKNSGCPSLPFYLKDTVDSPNAVIGLTYACNPNDQILFKDLSLGDDSHLWSFGDASTSTVTNPIHTYSAIAAYPVMLTTYNAKSGCRDTAYTFVDLRSASLSIIPTKRQLCRDVLDSFMGNGSGFNTPISKYKWYIDGTFKDSIHFQYITSFKTIGTHTITLLGLDKRSCYDTLSTTVLVAKPTANFNFTPTSGCGPMTVNFTDASTDVTGASIVKYYWTYGDLITSTLTTTSPTNSYTYNIAGSFSVKEIVTDNIGCMDTVTNPTKVTVHRPIASFTASTSNVCRNVNVHFTNSSVGHTSSLWIFGDGSTSTAVSPDHAYTAAGTYSIKLVVYDAFGCTDTLSKPSSLLVNTSPTSSFTMDDSFAVCPPLNVHFTNTTTGSPVSYLWAFGDGSFSTVTSPAEPYIASGLYTVLLVSKNALGCTDTATGHVNIFGYKGAFKYTPLKSCSPAFVHFNAALGVIASTVWDFGDGNTSGITMMDTISHYYVSPGGYVPKLILTDTSGCTAFSIGADTIKVDTLIPNFTFTPSSACQNTSVMFRDASSSLYSSSAKWFWTFGTGATSTFGTTTYTYSVAGTYPVTLTVWDSIGCTGTATKNITINPSPNAITGTKNVCVGATTTLSTTSGSPVWSSGNTAIAAIDPTGICTGISAGTTTITCTIPTGCYTTTTVTVMPLPNPIAGATGICMGLSTTLSGSPSPGTWTSSNTSVATIHPSTGFVSSVSIGTATISYKISTGCITTTTLAVTTSPSAITGTMTACLGQTSALSNTVTGGLWTSGNTTIAIIGSSSGIVMGTGLGTAAITYSLGTGCTVNTKVNVLPVPNPITGANAACSGTTFPLSDATPSGKWSSANTSIAIVGSTGIVSGVSGGADTIFYTLSTGCYAMKQVTINAAPPITGNVNICMGNTSSLSNSITGGLWVSLNTSIATVGSTSGIVTSKSVGSTTIKYTLPGSGCVVTTTVNIISTPAPITGPPTVCVGSVVSLTSATSGGIWTSDNTAIAIIGSSSGITGGVNSGTTLIYYSIGSGCKVFTTLVVNPISPVAGPSLLCAGQSSIYTDTTLGGVWSSSNTSVAVIGSGTGRLTAMYAGTSAITYTLKTGCLSALTLTVNALPLPITGSRFDVCAGKSILLSDPTPGGTWASGNTMIATIDPALGIVNGLYAGTTPITYTVGGCSIMSTVTVDPLPAAISGSTIACLGQTMTLSDASPGGIWSSSITTTASIGSVSGLVSGLAVGTTTITYTLSTGCLISRVQSVNPLPTAIKGIAYVCQGFSTTLTDATPGGTWSSNNTSIATIDINSGLASGITGGTTTITYTSAGCDAMITFTVNPTPDTIAGPGAVCEQSMITLSDGSAGGTWSSSNTYVATIGRTSGLLSGLNAGIISVVYKLPTGCQISRTIAVNPLPVAITGTNYLCTTQYTSLSDGTPGGTWTSTNTSIVTIDPISGLMSGIAAGTAIITYQLTSTGCAVSTTATVYQYPDPIVSTPNICLLTPTTFTDAVPGGTWSSDNLSIATVGSTSGVVTAVALGTANIYYTIGSSCSVSVAVSVMPLPTAYMITGGGTVCIGDTGVHIGLSGSAKGTNYFLYLGSTKATGPLAGSNSSLDFGLQTVGGSYKVIAVDASTNCTNTMTGFAVVNALPKLKPTVSVTAPFGDTICSGISTKFTAAITNGGTTPIYEWYVNSTKVSISTSTYTFIPADKDVVICKLTSNLTCATPTTATDIDTISVITPVLPSVTLATDPGDTICGGEKITLTALPVYGGYTPSYDWFVNKVPTGTGTAFTYVPVDKDIVYCKMTSTFPCKTATVVPSNNVVVTVDSPIIPHITISGNINVAKDDYDTLKAEVTDAGDAPSYQWFVNHRPVIGATTNTFISNSFSYPDKDSVTCMVTSSGLCTTTTYAWVYISVHPVGISQLTAGNGNMSIIPNPTTGDFEIKGTTGRTNDEDISIEITDLLGQVVYKGMTTTHHGVVDTRVALSNDLANAMYLVSLRSGGETSVFHLVLKR